jgi:TRAP-type mannitol/chloroaromatic compound transport system permease small subunit
LTFLLGASRLIDKLNEKIGKIATACVLIACAVSAGNALVRYALGQSSNAWLEIQWYLFGAIFLLGAAWTLERNEHVRVDIFYGHLSPRAQAWVDLLGGVFFLMPAAVIVAVLSWPFFVESYSLQEMSNNAGGLLRWPVKLLIPLGFALLALQGVSEIIKRIAVLAGEGAAHPTYKKTLQ